MRWNGQTGTEEKQVESGIDMTGYLTAASAARLGSLA